jgi:hypothetical protein
MQRVNEFTFYDLAMKIHPLVELSTDVKFSGVWFAWWEARSALSTICQQRPLSVSVGAASKLYREITVFLPEKWDDVIAKFPADASAEESIALWRLRSLKEAAKEFETVLAAECQVLDTYFVSKKGAYSTADLVERAHISFPPAILKQLPEQARNDFDQAGKCIALDVPTAAAFHLMRGTETVIRIYYKQITGKEPKKKMRNWHAYIKWLEEAKAKPEITSFLDHLRVSYRNPVLHPEDNVTEDQAIVLFGACVSVVMLMIEEVIRLSAKSATPLAFPATGGTLLGT